MTTGRINQVTIFAAVQPKPGANPADAGPSLVNRRGEEHPAGATSAELNRRGSTHGHPFATTEFSGAGSAEDTAGVPPDFRMPVPEGGYPSPVTSEVNRTAIGTRTFPQMCQ